MKVSNNVPVVLVNKLYDSLAVEAKNMGVSLGFMGDLLYAVGNLMLLDDKLMSESEENE